MAFQESSLVNEQGLRFHMREWIPDSSVRGMIFLLHGLADHGGRFATVGSYLSGRGFVFIAPDLRGNGLTDGKRGHFDSYRQVMNDIDFLFRKAVQKYPDLPCFIYGQSMGGNLALNYGLRKHPDVTGIIASSPWLRLAKPPAPFILAVGNTFAKWFPTLNISNGINADDLCRDREISKAYRKDPLVHGRISLNTFRIITDSGEWAIDNAGQLKAPLLLMHGSSDRITSLQASREFAAKMVKNLDFNIWEGFYHELHNEPEKQQVLDYLGNWLSTCITVSEMRKKK